MKVVAVLLLIAATASAIEWTDLRVKWKFWLLDPFHWSSYYQMPRTKADAISNDWVEVSGLSSLDVTGYCLDGDGRVCLYYDSYGNIAAIHAGMLVSDVADMQSIYNISVFNQYEIKTIFEEEYWTSTLLFISPDDIAAGGRDETNNLTGTEGIWFVTTDGYITIPRNVSDWDSAWTKENCIPEMGTHYYYAMNTSTECTAFQPWFLLEQDGELSGVGLQAFGSTTYKSRNWYEEVPAAAIRPTIPTTSDCVVEWAAEYGLISMHIYFTSKPWEYWC
ncbi:uncharacterized protein [Neodiprion pinetum]|nr:uncharacterized protein LOC124216613 isoform X2 [Neodiprion pinetum]XP_046477247.1 uncharacterized protein LOC124216613 isoform X2 [Neodiprion pinetum]XP_046477248.1 uncharacterized protein LOC124216613 isoform X2 [Neodiprion pinetum]XP_046477249.1 uncharacterized protein LOC124216613 isoform X2 [Neodiprion pinetum]XP_046477250.1 uncharacterized protein LOC124216613 isoform X2 [Neodiprion pinetum]